MHQSYNKSAEEKKLLNLGEKTIHTPNPDYSEANKENWKKLLQEMGYNPEF